MLIEQIIEFKLKGPGPPKLVIFMTNQKFSKKILEWLFTAKNIAGGNVPCFSHLGQVTYKI